MQEKGRMAVQTADLNYGSILPTYPNHSTDRPGILAETLGFIVDAGWNVVEILSNLFLTPVSAIFLSI